MGSFAVADYVRACAVLLAAALWFAGPPAEAEAEEHPKPLDTPDPQPVRPLEPVKPGPGWHVPAQEEPVKPLPTPGSTAPTNPPSTKPTPGTSAALPAPAAPAPAAAATADLPRERLVVPAEEKAGAAVEPPSADPPAAEKAPAPTPRLAAAIAKEEQARQDKQSLAPDEVVALYRGVVDAEPNNAEARYRYGLALARTGEARAACLELERALVLSPADPRYLTHFSTVAAQSGQLQKALAAAQKAVQLAPDSARAHNALGNAYLLTGDNPKAAEAYGTAVQLDPRNPRYIHNVGRACLSGGKPKLAVDVLSEVLRLDPNSAEAHNDRATAYRQLKDPRKAVEDLRAAVGLRPDFAPAHYNLALAYVANPELSVTGLAAALDHAQAAVRLTEGKDPQYLLGLAEAYRANRKYDKAVETARQASLLDPGKECLDRLAQYEQLLKDSTAGGFRP